MEKNFCFRTYLLQWFLPAALLSCGLFLPARAEDKPALPVIAEPVFKKDTFNIVSYGAKGDGLFLNSQNINRAIADCSSKCRAWAVASIGVALGVYL